MLYTYFSILIFENIISYLKTVYIVNGQLEEKKVFKTKPSEIVQAV